MNWRVLARFSSPINKGVKLHLHKGAVPAASKYLIHSFRQQRQSSSHFHQHRNLSLFTVSCSKATFSGPRLIKGIATGMGTKGSKQSGASKQGGESKQEETGTTSEQQQSQTMANNGDFVEAVVAKASEVPDGQMLEVDVGDEGKALLVHRNGRFTAIGNKCTHYGAPLAKGCLGDDRVRCPWHGACFSVETGDIEDYPGLDSLPRYDVRVEGNDVIVKADKQLLKTGRRPVAVSVSNCLEDRTILIIGGGPASVVCIETLRQEGFKGKIVLCSREDTLPYDRPKLSKAMHLTAADIALKPRTFYEELNVELKLGQEVTKVNVTEKSVTLSDGSSLSYGTLLLATGAVPRTLPVPGFSEHVHVLREPGQANLIATEAQGKKVVVIGTSFIGMEVAAYLVDKATSVDCIDIAAVPFERVLGSKVGKALQEMFESKGVKFHLKAGVKEIVAEDGKVTGVTLPSGDTIEADIVIAGVGVVPGTAYLKGSDVPMTNRGEVIVDKCMKAMDNVYAAGDTAQFPLPLTGDQVSIGHWQIAHNHGRVAARSMVGKEEPFNSIPYFWTVLFGKSLRYCGFALDWDEILYEGSPEELKFAAFFVKGEKVLAVSSLGMDPFVSTSAELMYQGKMPTTAQLKSNMDITSYLK